MKTASQPGGVGELGEVGKELCSCIRDQLQRSNGTRRQTWQERVPVVQGKGDQGINEYLRGLCGRKQTSPSGVKLTRARKMAADFQWLPSQGTE